MYYNINYAIIGLQLAYGSETEILFMQDSPHAEVQLVSLVYIIKVQILVTLT
jgi:hypothetical protein